MVWTAMVAAANSPEYKSNDPRRRWIVEENAVDANAASGHIQIHRVIARSLQLPQQKMQHDRRNWLFDIYLLPNDPPTVTFDALHSGLIPVHTVDEADRYFTLIDDILHHPMPQ